jgi:hypothetical protein
MEFIAAQECPSCGEMAYASHADRGISGCHTCQDKVCSECFYGCRYSCPVAVPPPLELERQINTVKWESAEEHLRNHPELDEVVVQFVPYEHLYVVVRTKSGRLVRRHYDRLCTSCDMLFVHIPGAEKHFVCTECWIEFLKKK